MARVVCQVLNRPERITFIWSQDKASFEPYHLTGAALEDVRRAGREAQNALESSQLATLAQAGHQLYRAMLPEAAAEVRAWLAALPSIEHLEIVSDAPASVPWNLVYDRPPDKPSACEFWGMRHPLGVGRRVNPWRAFPFLEEPEIVLAVDPVLRQQLPEAEKNRLATFAADKGLMLVESGEQLAAAIKSQPPDFIYLFCRADAEGLLLGNDRLKAEDLAALIEEERLDPIIFVNVAGSAAEAVRPFVGGGLHGLIASAAHVSADAANAFGVEFLQAMLYGGDSVGGALLKARQKIGLAGLAYNAYCPPNVRVAGEGMAENEGPEPAPLPDEPYRPLMPYDREDRALFAGRDNDVTAFTDLFDQAATRLLLLHGPSGVGKSSLLRAGVVPRLEDNIGYRALRDRTPEETPVAEEDHLVLAIRAGHDLAGQIAEALGAFCAQRYVYITPTGRTVTVDLPGILKSFAEYAPAASSMAIQAIPPSPASGDAPTESPPEEEIEVDPGDLWQRMYEDQSLLPRLIARITDRLPHELLIVIEQGEELYTQPKNPLPPRKRRQALDMLARTAATPSLCKWIVSLRTDQFGRLLHELPASADAITREFLLQPLTSDELLEAVLLPTASEPIPYSAEAPYGKYQFSYEDGVARRIVADVQQAARNSQQSVLPLLQAACTSLVANLQGRPDRVLHAGDVDDLGGVDAALVKYVEGQVKALPVARQEQNALRDLFETLYTRHPDGTLTRNLVLAQDVVNAWKGSQAGATVQQACEQGRVLEVNRLLVAGKENDYVGLTQDALARVGERWAEETRKRQFGRAKVIDLLWIFIPLLVLVAAVTMYFTRRTGGPGGVPAERVAELEKGLKRASRLYESATHAMALQKADQSWRHGSIFEAREYLKLAFQTVAEEEPTPFEWNYLARLVDGHRLALGKEPQFGALALSPDEKLAASASADGVIRVFETAKGEVRATLPGHKGPVHGLAFAGDGKTLVSASQDKSVRVWDVATAKEIAALAGHEDAVLAVAVSKDAATVVSAGEDKTAIVWSVKEGKPRFKLTGHSAAVRAVVFDPEAKTVATAGADHLIHVWETGSGKRLHELKGHAGPVAALAFAADGKTLASGGVEHHGGVDVGRVRQWDTGSMKEKGRPIYHGTGVFSVAYSRDGKLLFTAGKDEVIRVWDADSGAPQAAQPAHNDWVRSLAVGAEILASVARNDRVRLWDLQQLLAANVLRGHADWVTCVAFSPDGKIVVSGSRDNTIRLWDTASGKNLHTFDKLDGPVVSLTVTADKDVYRLAAGISTAADKGFILAWEVKTGDNISVKQLYKLDDHTGGVTAVGFAPDGKRLASTARDRTVRVWDAETGKAMHTLKGHKSPPTCLAWSLDGRMLATADEDAMIHRWDPAAGKETGVFGREGHSAPVTSLAFLTPTTLTLEKGQQATFTRLVSGSQDQSLRIWAAEVGVSFRKLLEHGGAVTCVAWNTKAGLLISAGWDEVLRTWSAESGTDRFTLTGHTGPVRAVAISPDGRTVASAGHDATVRLWRANAPIVRPKKRPDVEED